MKIGVITDIHSNIDALNAVLNKFQEIQVDKIICCGDIIGIGVDPEETVQALLRIKDILGCPMDSNTAKAGLIKIDNGRIDFKEINVEYDVKKVIEKIKKLKFPFYKEILKIFYGVNEL